ncbi:uncharacterized protein LOC134790948 [Cydia splendana]|uniref:uncharacterized protein LOC134790948 n=1 Tax=Cydia splendana TaxID=1100963 RepID=UPI0028F4BA38
MQPIYVLNCFKLCLLLLLCTADSSPDSISGSNEGNIMRLDAEDNREPDDDAVGIDDVVSNEAVADETRNADTIDEPVEDDDQGNNEPIDDENENNLQGDTQDANEQIDGVDAQGDDPDDNNPIDEEETEHEGQNDEPGEGEESLNTGVQDNDVPLGEQANTFKNVDQISAFKLNKVEIEKFKIWPEAKVPYFIDEFSYDKVLRDKIRSYLDYAQRRTYIHFHELTEPPKDENERWVFFVNRRGQLDCKDYSTKSFTNSGVQKVTVGYDCLRHGGKMAAIVLALLGVPPQHNSPDRGNSITIYGSNIMPEKSGLFKLLTNDEWLFHDFDYDYDSAGHYPAHKYTANGDRTIDIRSDKYRTGFPSFDNIINTEEPKDYSPGDINKIASLYNNIIFKAKKALKLEDCKALYRPGPGFGNTRLTQLKEIPERPKPKQYLSAVKKLYAYLDFYGETLSSLEDK